MSDTQSTFHRALQTLLTELADGPPGEGCFVLNPHDQGLVKQLESIDAATASSRPMPGTTTVADHANHLLYAISLMNRWAGGEENPFATADWPGSWKRGKVNEAEWRDVVKQLRSALDQWKKNIAARTEWADIEATGSMASVVHLGYHLGAIRQILAAQGKHKG